MRRSNRSLNVILEAKKITPDVLSDESEIIANWQRRQIFFGLDNCSEMHPNFARSDTSLDQYEIFNPITRRGNVR